MAGRGTDIKPSPEALALGGLYVLGTDKAESRRIDNQLRGRSGRQGDPGVSKFFLSIDDQLMRRFSNYEEFKEQFKNDGDKEVTTKSLLYGFSEAQKKLKDLTMTLVRMSCTMMMLFVNKETCFMHKEI